MCKRLYLIFVIICVIWPNIVYCDTTEDVWIEPNAWGREYHGLQNADSNSIDTCSKCSAKPCTNIEDDTDFAFNLYKKLIAQLFNENKLKYDKLKDVYTRSIQFVLTRAQLESLKTVQEPRDLDSVVSEIWLNVRTVTNNESETFEEANVGILRLSLDIFNDVRLLFKNSEMQFGLYVLLAVAVLNFLKRYYKLSKFQTLLATIVLIFGIGLYMHYRECNARLEAENMIAVLVENDIKSSDKPAAWWYNAYTFVFGKSDDKYDILRKNSKRPSSMCRPDEVVISYFTELFTKQIRMLVEELVKSIEHLRNRLPIIYFIPAIPFILIMVAFIIYLIFKHILSPGAWISWFMHLNTNSKTTQQQQSLPGMQAHSALTEDRLSGDNLKILLHAIGKPHMVVNNLPGHNPLPASGVQDVLEQLLPSHSTQENAPAIKCDVNDSSSTSASNTSINSFEVIKNDFSATENNECDSNLKETILSTNESL